MRGTQSLLKHIPLIKFVGGPHKHAKSVAGIHPMAPDGLKPSSSSGTTSSPFSNPNPLEPKDGEYFSRSQLPLRFRYKVPKEDEAANIVSGGAEIVF
ncbi:hypothetical protein PSN45_003598 [Yamadazyma tenuis]|uniref:Uncharacterized protein n=1 Tax=Candida tenuis (strain ATCC 10573 / BCRC 21748 / CBS 615 / JCM 9827 / NBRC 10315 / NRRL Y-1498 / VKM Y-70) TaxID=590646 RepID=G3AZN3_CANTC|nr:uncharacterized protein CANTEDRAFT_112498 [Yamadazyma tenuis ATCC 10573]EGV65629.1 hypothetical protein CANTEDRAFT_112498 [Yamadazyma tenuis ATCC 10573]WEJ96063.1 hypothetical protein PSN45_003598 [Yamadazyma tenuis]